MNKIHKLFVFIIFAVGNTGIAVYANERIVGLPCEGCEAVFEGVPSMIANTARIGMAHCGRGRKPTRKASMSLKQSALPATREQICRSTFICTSSSLDVVRTTLMT